MNAAHDGQPIAADRSPAVPGDASPPAAAVIPSRDLLRGGREVLIEHDGSLYRLRLTRNGKLILHK